MSLKAWGEALVAESPVERFDVRILIRFAGFNQAQRHAALVRPREDGASAELGAIVGAQHARQATTDCELIEHARERDAADRTGRHNRHRSGGRVIDDREAIQHAPFGRAIEHEVRRPDLVECLRPNERLAIGMRYLLTPPPFHLEPCLGVEPRETGMTADELRRFLGSGSLGGVLVVECR